MKTRQGYISNISQDFLLYYILKRSCNFWRLNKLLGLTLCEVGKLFNPRIIVKFWDM